MHYFIVWKLPYISVCASRLYVIDSIFYNNYLYEDEPVGYFIQTSEHHVIFVQVKDDYASRNQQDYYSKENPPQTFSNRNFRTDAYRIVIKICTKEIKVFKHVLRTYLLWFGVHPQDGCYITFIIHS